MVRLTAELAERCPQYINPLREREVDLRGHKIVEIENLGVLRDMFDSIDMSDNEVEVLGNLPLMPRLKSLIIHNNRLASITAGLCHCLPNLENLMLHNNNFKALEELAPLSDLPTLQRLSLVDNPVTKHPSYRLFVVSRLPNLKQLDFTRVRPTEREEAKRKFGTPDAPASAPAAKGMSDEERRRIAALISSASSLEEIKRIEERELPPVSTIH